MGATLIAFVVLAVATGAARLVAAEPAGIRLRPLWEPSAAAREQGEEPPQPLMLPWGSTQDDLRTTTGRRVKGMTSRGGAVCLELKDVKEAVVCTLLSQWTSDFGDPNRKLEPSLFYYQDKLYAYTIGFDSEADFSFVLNALTSALGKPTSSRIDALQNRMGATFRSQSATWTLAKVTVELEERSDNLDEGAVRVRYKPLEPPDSAVVRGSAPF